MTRHRPLTGDHGNAPLEFTIIAVPALCLAALILVGGRIALASDAVQAAASEAARAASISRSAGEAQAAAAAGASAILSNRDLFCETRAVTVDTTGFSLPVGTPAQVQATVRCDVAFTTLTFIPGVPGTKTITATMTSPLDTYRDR